MILILNCGSSKTQYIEDAVDRYVDYHTIPILDFKETDLDQKMGVIISGAPILVTEQDISAYLKQLQWLKTTTIPVLGICFGHQLLGIIHGSYAVKIREDRDWQTIAVFEDHPLFDKFPEEFEMMEDHCETISIAPEFKLIGSSDACVNEVMVHQTKNLFGVQFHPEVSGNMGALLFENFYKICLESKQQSVS